MKNKLLIILTLIVSAAMVNAIKASNEDEGGLPGSGDILKLIDPNANEQIVDALNNPIGGLAIVIGGSDNPTAQAVNKVSGQIMNAGRQIASRIFKF